MSVMLNFMVFSHRCKLMLVCLVDLSVLADAVCCRYAESCVDLKTSFMLLISILAMQN
jgi:hypothetical protein